MSIIMKVSPPRGYSAYEIAVQYGFEGTEAEWNAAVNSERLLAEAAAQTATEQAGIATSKAEQTALDRTATGQDRVATGQDRIATGEDRVAAANSAQTATEQAGTATEQAGIATTARGYLESFLFHYIDDDVLSVTVGIGTQVLVSESTSGYPSVLLELSVP